MLFRSTREHRGSRRGLHVEAGRDVGGDAEAREQLGETGLGHDTNLPLFAEVTDTSDQFARTNQPVKKVDSRNP